ncbi:hypothetical protein M8J76_001355 [Diaphorina citri]|nr:hypothetical protein M8J75_002253 [Diaphorina citri]KAI5744329.1 hypothetical protein M8J76_001355 [Diaphorina citri]
MHSRFSSFLRKQSSSIFQTIKNSKNSSNQVKSLLKCDSTAKTLSQTRFYSIDASKNSEDLQHSAQSEDVNGGLGDISIDVINSAIDNIDYDAITEGDPELLSKLKLFVLEVDSMFQDGHNIPSQISTSDWKNILTLPSKHQRSKYLTFLFKKEMIKANEKARKEARRCSQEEIAASRAQKLAENKHIFYGPDIIIDMDYYDYMNNMEQSLLAKQLLFMLSENRLLWEPYNLIFSSFYKESIVAQKLTMVVNNLYMDDFPFNYTSKHFTELNYSREELVYLTPHTNNVLLEHTPGSVYIIGGMLDKRITQPLSLAKAKKEKIRAAKLPLDNFLDWGTGHKSLTLNQVLAIMNDWRRTNDWKYSFRHIPKRKLNRGDDSLYLNQNEGRNDSKISAKFIKERKKRQLVYDLLLKR